MYTSQFKEIDPYDWFCGPGSHTVYMAYHLKQVSGNNFTWLLNLMLT